MRKGAKFTPEQLERVRAANLKKSTDPKWREATKAAGKKRSQNPKWSEAMKAAGEKRARNPKWQEATKEASLRPEVIEAKTVYGARQPWNRATITTDKNLTRYDQGLCRYCTQPRQPDRKDCRNCMLKHLEDNRIYRQRKKAAKNGINVKEQPSSQTS